MRPVAGRLQARLACRRIRSGGQAMMEYVVVCSALALALGLGMADDSSVLWEFINQLRLAYSNFSYAISLPT